MGKKVMMPLKKSLMEWLKVFKEVEEDLGYKLDEFERINYLRGLLNEDFSGSKHRQSNIKASYVLFYMDGFSINEISALFNVSKQYIDTIINKDKDVIKANEENRLLLQSEMNKFVYVLIPEIKGFTYLHQLGFKSNENALMSKYKEFGGELLKSKKDLRDEMILNVYEDFNNGMTYKDMSKKYGKTMKTISDYLNICRELGFPFKR